jgi:hypothetical protein
MSTVAAPHRHSAVGRFFRNPKTDEIVVFQVPNIPLWLFLAATVARAFLHPKGTVGTGVSIVAGVSLAVWAVLEIARGDSPFRRVLGAVVLAGALLGYLMR